MARRSAAGSSPANAAPRDPEPPPRPDAAGPVAVQPVVLAETLDLLAAAPLRSELLARRGQGIVIDAAAAQRMGAQCLQVLLSARATWAADGHSFSITGASADFAEAATLLGAPGLISPADA